MEKKEKVIDISVFVVLIGVFAVMMFVLFYNQATGDMTKYPSDMEAYILEMQGLESGYNFPYPMFFKLAAFFHLFLGPSAAIALATTLLNTLAIISLKILFNKFALNELRDILLKCKWLAGILLSILTLSVFYISMVYPPGGIYLPGISFRYMGVFSPNPLHNATYLAARPFAILAFFWFAKLLPEYEQACGETSRTRWKDYALFALFLLLATMTKPSFTLVLVGTAGVIMAYRLIRTKFRNIKPTLLLTLCFLPTFAHLIYQYSGVFMPETGEESGLGFSFGEVWKHYTNNIPIAIGLAFGFPILVLLLNYKELKRDIVFRFSWQISGMGLIMMLFLYEKGFRAVHMNFSWGYMYGIFFAFVGSLFVLLRTTLSWKINTHGKAGASKNWFITLILLQWLAYGWHLYCGIQYFIGIYRGGTYY